MYDSVTGRGGACMLIPCCAATYSRGNVESHSQGYGCGEEVGKLRKGAV